MEKQEIVAIIGASSFIGNSLYNACIEKLPQFTPIGTFFSHKKNNTYVFLDVKKKDEIENFLTQYNPNYIIIVSGIKDVKRCEDDFTFAMSLNVQPVKDLVDLIGKLSLQCKVLFISSDYVFDGETGNYRDDDPPNPKTNYGLTKLLAEKILTSSSINYKIVRTSAVIGKGSPFFDWLMEALKKNEKIEVFDDVFFSPTPISMFVESMIKLLENYDSIVERIIHISGGKRISRYNFATFIKTICSSDSILIPINGMSTGSLFQHDLSLCSSNLLKDWDLGNVEEYFQQEIAKYD